MRTLHFWLLTSALWLLPSAAHGQAFTFKDAAWVGSAAAPALSGGGGSWPAPVGWWKLNDGSSGTATSAADSSANNFTMTFHASPAWVASTLVFGNAVSCVAGTVDFGDCAGEVAGQVAGSSTASLAFWFKTSTVEGPQCGFGHSDFFCRVENGTACYDFCYAGGSGYRSSTQITDGAWHHYVMVFDGSLSGSSRLAIYLDHVLQSYTYSGATGTALGSAANLGTFKLNEAEFLSVWGTCAYNDVRLYSVALTQAEVDHIYNGGTGTLSQ